MSRDSHAYMISFLKEFFFNINYKTTFTEEERQILDCFISNITPEYNEDDINFSLIINGHEVVERAIQWAYTVFLHLLHNRSYKNNLNYRDLVKSESFTHLLNSLNQSSPDRSRLLISQICIDFSSLCYIISGNDFIGSSEVTCWQSDFNSFLWCLEGKDYE